MLYIDEHPLIFCKHPEKQKHSCSGCHSDARTARLSNQGAAFEHEFPANRSVEWVGFGRNTGGIRKRKTVEEGTVGREEGIVMEKEAEGNRLSPSNLRNELN